MFNVFKTNKMENLVGALVSVLKDVPDDPMVPEWIGVQSRGMKQWITLETAASLGICANFEFLYPRQIIDRILKIFSSDLPEWIDENFIFWSLMGLIHDRDITDNLPDIGPYIKTDRTGRKKYQLAAKLADIFDDYQIYRPLMLLDWANGKNHSAMNDPAALWQAELWQKIVKSENRCFAYQSVKFLKSSSDPVVNNIAVTDILPARICLFGISAIPGLFMQVFEKISCVVDINLFTLCPSPQYFFDMKSEKQVNRLALQDSRNTEPSSLYYETGNPLLSSLGLSAGEFFAGLESFDYHEPEPDLFCDPFDDCTGQSTEITMLKVLQSDIFNLVNRKDKCKVHPPVHVDSCDNSIEIHACHSPLREAQVLKDILLNELENDPELALHDIIVMTPDIETYAPFIEAAFSCENSLGFSISDRRKRCESQVIAGFIRILDLKNSRLERSLVLDLLSFECIADKFQISSDEIPVMEKIVKHARILWGRDSEHRDSLGMPAFEENTWNFGLARLFMGMAMPENYDALVSGVLPCQSLEGSELEILGKLSAFCNAVFTLIDSFEGNATFDRWARVFISVCSDMIDRNSRTEEDMFFLVSAIEDMRKQAEAAGFDNKISFDTAAALVIDRLDLNVARGSFLSGRITVCNIMPMRAIPFKIVVLMGMDEKSFPRRAFGPGFDLVRKYPAPGDKSERSEDRYLFLETLLSARSKFICTYTGQSIKDNSVIPCSGVLSELIDVMKKSFIFPEGFLFHFFHPLHPFSESYFNCKAAMFSFSSDNCRIAQALARRTGKTGQKHSENIKSEKSSSADRPCITLEGLIRFFKNPVAMFMQDILGIQIPEPEGRETDQIPFSLDGLEYYLLRKLWIEKNMRQGSDQDLYPLFKAMGVLPSGNRSVVEYKTVQEQAKSLADAVNGFVSPEILPDIRHQISFDGFDISAGFSDIRKTGLYFITSGNLSPSRRLSAWIRHLAYNIAAPCQYPKQTLTAGYEGSGKNKKVVVCSFAELSCDHAEKLLAELGKLYLQGMEQPLCFFCDSAWQFAKILEKDEFDPGKFNMTDIDSDLVNKAMKKALDAWEGGYRSAGERDNPYIDLLLSDITDPFESVETLLSSGFIENTVKIYFPLLQNMEVLS